MTKTISLMLILLISIPQETARVLFTHFNSHTSISSEAKNRNYDRLHVAPSSKLKTISAIAATGVIVESSNLAPRRPRVKIAAKVLTSARSLGIYQQSSDYLSTYDISEVRDLAFNLNYDPVQIYYYVKNNIDYEPYFGPMAGIEWTLKLEAGNSFDQASLLIALLRESGIPARYVYGTIEVPEENATKWLRVESITQAANFLNRSGIPVEEDGNLIRLEHAWVEAYIAYQDFSEQIESEVNSNWISLDPSFKTYNFIPGLEPRDVSEQASRFLDETIADSQHSEEEMWITGINADNVTEGMIDVVNASIKHVWDDSSLHNRTLMQLFGYWELKKDDSNFLPATLPYDVISVLDTWEEIPEEYYHKINFKFELKEFDDITFGEIRTALFNYTVLSSEIAGKRVGISFVAATKEDEDRIEAAGGIFDVTPTDVNMIPLLMIDGEIVAQGSETNSVNLGEVVFLTTEFSNDISSYSYPIEKGLFVGSHYAFVFNNGKLPSRLVEEHAADLDMTNFRLLNDESVTKDDLVGQLLYINGLTYFYQLDFFTDTQSLPNHIRWYRPIPSLAITSMNVIVSYDDSDTFGLPIEMPGLPIGTPIALRPGGMSIDVRFNQIAHVGKSASEERNFKIATGISSSALEHEIYNQLYDVSAVSTMKILEEANTRNIPICILNQTNIGEPDYFTFDFIKALELPTVIETFIWASVLSGQTVIVPREELQIENWTGIGWITLDLETGDCGFFITAGLSGGDVVEKIDWINTLLGLGFKINEKINTVKHPGLIERVKSWGKAATKVGLVLGAILDYKTKFELVKDYLSGKLSSSEYYGLVTFSTGLVFYGIGAAAVTVGLPATLLLIAGGLSWSYVFNVIKENRLIPELFESPSLSDSSEIEIEAIKIRGAYSLFSFSPSPLSNQASSS